MLTLKKIYNREKIFEKLVRSLKAVKRRNLNTKRKAGWAQNKKTNPVKQNRKKNVINVEGSV